MIGDLLHYNSAGSKSMGIVTDFFRYEGKQTRVVSPGDILVAIEWIRKETAPSPITPDWYRMGPESARDEDYWPVNWETKNWYNLRYFRVISKIEEEIV
tara:strand:- start:390 stop:686 length:297 start_codon:yes stop_codon:yes gene_type:complete